MQAQLLINWILFIALAVIWGSSFILMKLGIETFSPIQVASIRIIASAIVLFPLGLNGFKILNRSQIGYSFASGFLGSFFPAYLFCYAEVKVDSALAGTLNSLTPVFVILIGVIFYKLKLNLVKVLGVAVALFGSVLLLLSKNGFQGFEFPLHTGMIILATVFYGWNVHLVNRHLKELNSLHVVSIALLGCSLPALLLLWWEGFPVLSTQIAFLKSFAASVVLGIFGTALASVLFYKLIKGAGVIFSSMVTYTLPVIAIFWGIALGEKIGLIEIICLLIILLGVYLANKKIN